MLSSENAFTSCIMPAYLLLRMSIAQTTSTEEVQMMQAELLKNLDEQFAHVSKDCLHVSSIHLDTRFKNALITEAHSLEAGKQAIVSECTSASPKPTVAAEKARPQPATETDPWNALLDAITSMASQ